MQEQLITISPEIMGGTPVFSNTRVPIKNLFYYFKYGRKREQNNGEVTLKNLECVIF